MCILFVYIIYTLLKVVSNYGECFVHVSDGLPKKSDSGVGGLFFGICLTLQSTSIV